MLLNYNRHLVSNATSQVQFNRKKSGSDHGQFHKVMNSTMIIKGDDFYQWSQDFNNVQTTQVKTKTIITRDYFIV